MIKSLNEVDRTEFEPLIDIKNDILVLYRMTIRILVQITRENFKYLYTRNNLKLPIPGGI